MASLKKETLRQLTSRIKGLDQSALTERGYSFISSQCGMLDDLIPGGGLPLGGLVEVLSDEASGALRLSLSWAQKSIASKAAWAVLDAGASFYPPAAQPLGLEIAKLILVRCPARQAAWAFNQLLRCPDVGASFLDAHDLGRGLDNMTYRRLQLAAERGQGLGFILRPREAARRPCWAALRLLVEPNAEQKLLRVTLLHARGASRSGSGDSIEIGMNHATLSVPVPSAMAAATLAV